MCLYAEFYGEELTIDDARAMASRVLLLYEMLARPLPDEGSVTEDGATPPPEAPDPPSFAPGG
jgi:hypothetical protein